MKTAVFVFFVFFCQAVHAQGFDTFRTQYPIEPFDMEILDENHWILLGQHDTTLIGPYYLVRTKDGGKSWEKIIPPFAFDGIAFPHQSTLYASGGGSLYVSPDMGDTWEYITSDIGGLVSFPDRKHGFTTLAKSTDSGKTWVGLPLPKLPTEGSLVDINFRFQDSVTGFLALTRRDHQAISSVYFTSNGGGSWGRYTNSNNNYFAHSMLRVGVRSWIVSLTGYGSFRSTNDGESWDAGTGDFRTEAAISSIGKIFGAAGHYSDDSGKTSKRWNHEFTYDGNLVRTLGDSTAFISTPSTVYWRGGNLIFRINSPSLAFVPKSSVKPKEDEDERTVKYDVTSKSLFVSGFTETTSIELYDILGRKLGAASFEPHESSQSLDLHFSGQPIFYTSGERRGRVRFVYR